VDTTTGTISTIGTSKAPEGLVMLDTRYLATITSDGDEVVVVDTLPAGGSVVTHLPVLAGLSHGASPSGIAYDAPRHLLYVTVGALNAVVAFDVGLSTTTAPTLSPVGSFGTEWWPTAVSVRDDGSLVVINGKGRGTGSSPIPFGPGNGDITDRMRGSIQLVPAPDAAMLAAGTTALDAATDMRKVSGASTVDCAGAPYDFPVPATNTDGPSTKIKHIVFVVKENKAFDAVYGDLGGNVDGDPTLVMAPGNMSIFANQRAIAKGADPPTRHFDRGDVCRVATVAREDHAS
jgi:hypothetical protein